jgi:hypothetical protein
LLLALLLKFEELFDGMLGDWKLLPVSLELKEGAKPYHGRPYPIPKIHGYPYEGNWLPDIDGSIKVATIV